MKWLDRTLLVNPYHLGLCLSAKAFRKALRGLGIPKADRPGFVTPGSDATTYFFERGDKGLCAIVCIGRKPKGTSRSAVCGLLIHEAMHVWQRARRAMGEHAPGDEGEAYAVQNIAQQLMEAYGV